jgi:hypothetical protein
MYPQSIEPRPDPGAALLLRSLQNFFGTLKTAILFFPKLNVPINVPVNSRFRPLIAAIFHLPVLVSRLPFFWLTVVSISSPFLVWLLP